MKTKVYLSIVFATALIAGSMTSCLRKETTCRCKFANGEDYSYNLRHIDNKQDSCITLDKQAELNAGNCVLK